MVTYAVRTSQMPVMMCVRMKGGIYQYHASDVAHPKRLENKGGKFDIMHQLTKCPKCKSRLIRYGRIQVCIRCGYLTRVGTANLDSIIVSCD